jgi:SAM-dependent methyltransferase
MNRGNWLFWKKCSEKYSRYFNSPSKVLEMGSYNVNGTVRDHFSVDEYIGIDWRDGPCVDVVSLAHEVRFPYRFDTVISASMLEHDPYWWESLDNMVKHLQHDGIIILTWGPALNKQHGLKTAPDRKFHALKAGALIRHLEKCWDMYIHEFSYEPWRKTCIADLVAFNDRKFAMGDRVVEELMEEDKV